MSDEVMIIMMMTMKMKMMMMGMMMVMAMISDEYYGDVLKTPHRSLGSAAEVKEYLRIHRDGL